MSSNGALLCQRQPIARRVAPAGSAHDAARTAGLVLTFSQLQHSSELAQLTRALACSGKGPEIICGHSLGGKVILDYCRQTGQADSPLRPPHHAWVLDSQPGPVAKDMVPDVGRVLQAVKVLALCICAMHMCGE